MLQVGNNNHLEDCRLCAIYNLSGHLLFLDNSWNKFEFPIVAISKRVASVARGGRSTMSELRFAFDREKAIETILYIANRIERPTYHSITHLLYFADKTSLERYGRFICGDDYYAMENGPVPSNIYNLLKESQHTDQYGFVTDPRPRVKPLRDANPDFFSRSDIECLDQAIASCGEDPFWKIKGESHDEAYVEAWENRGSKASQRMKVESIAGMLMDSDELIAYLKGEESKA